MYIIKDRNSIELIKGNQIISQSLIEHLERKFNKYQKRSIVVGILKKNDRNLKVIGLPESLKEIMPDWISCLKLSDDNIYYVLYIDEVQLYLPDSIMEDIVRAWLLEQPNEEGYE